MSAGFFDQMVGTAILLLLIFAITDERNSPPGANMTPVVIGLLVVAIGMSFGGMHGYAINPARDLGPRLFTVVAGFRNNGITDGLRVWWVPVVAPMIGALIGAGNLRFRAAAIHADAAVDESRGRAIRAVRCETYKTSRRRPHATSACGPLTLASSAERRNTLGDDARAVILQIDRAAFR